MKQTTLKENFISFHYIQKTDFDLGPVPPAFAITPHIWVMNAIYRVLKGSKGELAKPWCSRLQSSPNIQSGKYNEMDPILIGTAVSVVS